MAGEAFQSFAIIWLDPVSLNLCEPGVPGTGSPGTNDLVQSLDQRDDQYSAADLPGSVGGNVEVIVMADVAGTF